MNLGEAIRNSTVHLERLEHFSEKQRLTSIGSLVTQARINQRLQALKQTHSQQVYLLLVADIAGAIAEQLDEEDEYEFALELSEQVFAQIVGQLEQSEALQQEADQARAAGYVNPDDETVLGNRVIALVNILIHAKEDLDPNVLLEVESNIQLLAKIEELRFSLEPTTAVEIALNETLVEPTEEEELLGFSNDNIDFVAKKLGMTIDELEQSQQTLQTEITCLEFQQESPNWNIGEFIEFLQTQPVNVQKVSIDIQNVLLLKTVNALIAQLQTEPLYKATLLKKARQLLDCNEVVTDNELLQKYLFSTFENIV